MRVANGFGLGYCLKYLFYFYAEKSGIYFMLQILGAILRGMEIISMSRHLKFLIINNCYFFDIDIFAVNKILLKVQSINYVFSI